MSAGKEKNTDVGGTEGLKLLYEGSVKKVFSSPDTQDRLFFHFTDDYSVFDWGKMPDTIENKGRALATMGAFFFNELGSPEIFKRAKTSEHLKRFDKAFLEQRFNHPVFSGVCGVTNYGVPHHFKNLHQNGAVLTELENLQAEPPLMEVLTARVERPSLHQIDGQPTYFYPQTQAGNAKRESAGRRLVPLEIVFRFGMPAGSSLKERIEKNPDYARTLGLAAAPKEGEWLARPVIEFFTKLEPKDRLLTVQEAAHVSGLSGDEFESLCEMAYASALALFVLFAEHGIELWDGKFEMIVDYGSHDKDPSGGVLLLADSVGPDELRLIYRGVHLSKEMIRRIYRGSEWEKSLQKAQKLAKERGSADWKQIAVDELKAAPEKLAGLEKTAVNKLYGCLTNHLTGKEVFKDHPTLDQYIDALPAALKGDQKVGTAQSKK